MLRERQGTTYARRERFACAKWLRHFLDLSRDYLGLATASASADAKPDGLSPLPGVNCPCLKAIDGQ
jgi:hypothetical protein